MRLVRWLFLAVVVLGLLSACTGASSGARSTAAPGRLATAQAQPPAPLVGRLAPEFSVARLNGEGPLTLGELRGRPVVLNFWATWCGPCRLEMPELDAVYRARKGGIAIVGVQIQDDSGDARAFLQEVGVMFPVARDADGQVQAAYLKRTALPTTFFIDRDGIVRYVQVGPMTSAFIQERLRELES